VQHIELKKWSQYNCEGFEAKCFDEKNKYLDDNWKISNIESLVFLVLCSFQNCKFLEKWHAPKFLVRPKKGPTMLKSGNSWNLVSLLASNTKGGDRGMLKVSGLD
jgi:hypothetical protein